jgi:hypothetical protein
VVARRWCDLLILEGIALQVVASQGIPAAHTNVIETPERLSLFRSSLNGNFATSPRSRAMMMRCSFCRTPRF